MMDVLALERLHTRQVSHTMCNMMRKKHMHRIYSLAVQSLTTMQILLLLLHADQDCRLM